MAKSRQSLMKTACGHRVKSKAEKRIDDWLHRNGWISIYEPEIKFRKTKTQPDWVLLPQNVNQQTCYCGVLGLIGSAT